MAYMETQSGFFIYIDRDDIEAADRAQLQEWLEYRGTAVYDDESTELLREVLIEDYENEMV